MKLQSIFLLFAAACAVAAQDPAPAKQPANRTTQPAPARRAPASPQSVSGLPKEAKEVEPYLWSYTDSAGKKWLYRQTPFGYARWEDIPVAEVRPNVDQTNPIDAVEEGDVVHFTWTNPLGTQRWDRKKSELNDAEKQALDLTRQRQQKAAQIGIKDKE